MPKLTIKESYTDKVYDGEDVGGGVLMYPDKLSE